MVIVQCVQYLYMCVCVYVWRKNTMRKKIEMSMASGHVSTEWNDLFAALIDHSSFTLYHFIHSSNLTLDSMFLLKFVEIYDEICWMFLSLSICVKFSACRRWHIQAKIVQEKNLPSTELCCLFPWMFNAKIFVTV